MAGTLTRQANRHSQARAGDRPEGAAKKETAPARSLLRGRLTPVQPDDFGCRIHERASGRRCPRALISVPPIPKDPRPTRTDIRARTGVQLSLRQIRGKRTFDLQGHSRRMSEVNGTIWLVCGPDSRFLGRPALAEGTIPPFGSPKSLSTSCLSAGCRACSALLEPERATFATVSCPAWSSTPPRIAALWTLSFKPDGVRLDHLRAKRFRVQHRRYFLLSGFPKITPPSLPNRRVHSQIPHCCGALRQLAATPSGCSDRAVSHRLAGFLLVDPVRTVAAAHDPGVHHRFTTARARSIPVMLVCPSKLSLRLQLSRQMSESTLLPPCFSASARGGSLLLPGRHPALLLPRSFGPSVAGRSVRRFQP